MHILKILTVAFLAINATGCGCTEVGCTDGLVIDLKSTSSTWAPGTYVFDVDADGTKSTCTIDLPAVADPSCANPTQMQLNLGTKDATVPGQILNFVAAAKVTLTVSRDGAEIAKKVFTPTYTENQPNGPSCEPTCKVAKDEIAVP